MGYTLKIGDLVVDYDQDEDYPNVSLTAKGFAHDGAPAFGEPTDHTSERWPSYSGWSEFTQKAGIYTMFYGKEHGSMELSRDDALLRHHPGCVPLTECHRREVNAALAAWKVKYPDATPTFGKPAPEGERNFFWVDEDNPEENSQMTRLVWLHYWINWALDNCEQPVFENS
jgi:hypothetical protein|tara:strand:+ start:976 stop:1488 length:513 start_codon:yes stop_codon:yes gene_type:complete